MSENFLSRGGLSLDRLKNFCAVADAGGISAAADGDPGKQSLYSRQIRELEEFFGVELTARQGRRVVLTAAGEELARLIRGQLSGLDDFQQRCRALPQSLTLAAGNSILEWLLIPRLQYLRAGISASVNFEILSLRTRDVVAGLLDMNIDLAVVRSDAVARLPNLASRRAGVVTYALFVPADLADGLSERNLKQRLPEIPLATSAGGQFRERVERDALSAKWTLRIALSCSSFTQAARTVQAGGYAAILPTLARPHLPPAVATEFNLPFLKQYARPLSVVWNRRLASVRAVTKSAAELLPKILQ